MKYIYEYHDGDEWIAVDEQEFDSPAAAKQSGIEAGFENVRAVVFAG